MQISDRSGIVCDHCGTIYKNDFVYYSWDFHSVSVYNNIRPPLNTILNSNTTFSLDICQPCFGELSQKIVEIYQTKMNGKSKGLVCELSGVVMVGSFSYYYINVTKVDVKSIGQPNVCVKCHTKTFEEGQPCKCGCVEFIKPAVVTISERFLETMMSEDSYTRLRQQAEQLRKVASQWSSEG